MVAAEHSKPDPAHDEYYIHIHNYYSHHHRRHHQTAQASERDQYTAVAADIDGEPTSEWPHRPLPPSFRTASDKGVVESGPGLRQWGRTRAEMAVSTSDDTVEDQFECGDEYWIVVDADTWDDSRMMTRTTMWTT